MQFWVVLPVTSLSINNSRQIVDSHMPVIKQHNLVLVKRWWCSVAVKVTVGQASHWPCITDFVVYPPTGLVAQRGRWANNMGK